MGLPNASRSRGVGERLRQRLGGDADGVCGFTRPISSVGTYLLEAVAFLAAEQVGGGHAVVEYDFARLEPRNQACRDRVTQACHRRQAAR